LSWINEAWGEKGGCKSPEHSRAEILPSILKVLKRESFRRLTSRCIRTHGSRNQPNDALDGKSVDLADHRFCRLRIRALHMLVLYIAAVGHSDYTLSGSMDTILQSLHQVLLFHSRGPLRCSYMSISWPSPASRQGRAKGGFRHDYGRCQDSFWWWFRENTLV